MNFDLTKIIEELQSNENVRSLLPEDSSWRKHSLKDYEDHDFSCMNYTEEAISENQVKSLQYYFDKEAVFYQKIIKALSISIDDIDEKYDYDMESYLEGSGIEAPEVLNKNWLLQNVKLIGVELKKELNETWFLELDLAVSWDVEHGLRALLYKDEILAFGEGGMCWSYDLAYYQ